MIVEVEGVQVDFPGVPYESQMEIMRSLIKGLNDRENCLLESPTGSGKTLALLCAALAWLKKRKTESSESAEDSIPTIYFGTRTHKQIASVIKELHKTEYKDIHMAILASREHTCIDDSISSSDKKTDSCRKARANYNSKTHECGCMHYTNFRKSSSLLQLESPIWDIEDLVTHCRPVVVCPYFLTRQFASVAEIVFCPYNYLIDRHISRNMNVQLDNNIVILDEGHNIEDACRSTTSSKMSLSDLSAVISDLECKKESTTEAVFDYFLKTFEDLRNWVTRSLPQPMMDKTWSCEEIIKEFNKFVFSKANLSRYLEKLKELNEIRVLGEPLKSDTTNKLTKFGHVLQDIYDEKNHEDFKVLAKRDFKFYSLHFLCLNPAVGFRIFNKCRSVVLCSGTLSPLDTFESELGVTFTHKLEASHVIPNEQVWVSAVGYGPKNVSLRADYKNRKTDAFKEELGRFIQDACNSVPFGVLCFFPSYSLLNELIAFWTASGCIQRIKKKKTVFIEGKTANEFNSLIDGFYSAIDSATAESEINGALLFAVYRGRASEGIDFKDNYARAVLAVGLPLPSLMDKEVKLKRDYNNQMCKTRGLLNGEEWYNIQAYRAINQALGRCIRHKDDWGAIVLIDSRYFFQPDKYINGLSKWIKKRFVKHSNYQDTVGSLKEFVKSMKTFDVSFVSSPNRTVDLFGDDGEEEFEETLLANSELDGDVESDFCSPMKEKRAPFNEDATLKIKRKMETGLSISAKRRSNDI